MKQELESELELELEWEKKKIRWMKIDDATKSLRNLFFKTKKKIYD